MKILINDMISPVIDTPPCFSWEYPDGEFSSQTSYALQIAPDDSFAELLCDISVTTDERADIRPVLSLSPRTKYFVRVSSALENGSVLTGETSFQTGMLGSVWNARWITGHNCVKRDEALAAQYLRRKFSVGESPVRAMLYVCGLGYFEAHINGNKVGDDFLSTPYTAFDKNILYRAFDVTDMLNEGANAIGVILGNGFYNCFSEDPWQSAQAPWRDVPKLLCELHIEYKDGSDVIVSDRSWESVEGPIIFNGLRHGEIYDARLEKQGWDTANYTGDTEPCRMAKNPAAILSVMEIEPVRVRTIYKPQSVVKVENGYLYDIGQDQAGIANIVFRGKRGDTFKMRYSNRVHDNGELDQESLSGFIKNYFFQTDTFTKGKDEPESWHPIFTYHGFRYIEISGDGTLPSADDIEVWSLCNDLENRGSFSSDDETVNAIQKLCLASTTSCCINTLVSDTVREKTSWTGDTGLSCEQLLTNFKAVQLMKKWLSDLRDSQRPGGSFSCIVPSAGWGYNSMNGPDWAHPIVDVPWSIYISGGDTEVLAENYPALLRHCDYIASMANDDIPSFGLGDWCAPLRERRQR